MLTAHPAWAQRSWCQDVCDEELDRSSLAMRESQHRVQRDQRLFRGARRAEAVVYLPMPAGARIPGPAGARILDRTARSSTPARSSAMISGAVENRRQAHDVSGEAMPRGNTKPITRSRHQVEHISFRLPPHTGDRRPPTAERRPGTRAHLAAVGTVPTGFSAQLTPDKRCDYPTPSSTRRPVACLTSQGEVRAQSGAGHPR